MPMYFKKLERHPAAEQLGWAGINLPSYPALSVSDIEFICFEVKKYFELKNVSNI